jgi:3-deoxy-D-manno-octulosonate 8-phosphate phosphatase (KDO 8-P phosphatase)
MQAASKIKLLVLDVDGVMTDGRIILDDNGVQYKAFHVRDGHGIKMLMRQNVDVAIITGRKSEVLLRRAEELGIEHVYQRSFNKLESFAELKDKLGVKDDESAFVGDDLVDLPVMRQVGLSVAVADAEDDVKTLAAFVTKRDGGRGAVREVTDLILKAKGLWDEATKNYMET